MSAIETLAALLVPIGRDGSPPDLLVGDTLRDTLDPRLAGQ